MVARGQRTVDPVGPVVAQAAPPRVAQAVLELPDRVSRVVTLVVVTR